MTRKIYLSWTMQRLLHRLIIITTMALVMLLAACGEGGSLTADSASGLTQNNQSQNNQSEDSQSQDNQSQASQPTLVQNQSQTGDTTAADSEEPSDNDHHRPNTENRFTNSTDDIWPPQPKNISNLEKIVITGIDPATPDKKELQRELAKTAMLSNSTIRSALDQNHTVLTSQLITNKLDEPVSTEFHIFNYDSNQVLTVTVGNNEQVSYTKSDASEYQPPETQAEAKTAIALARTDLQAQGYTTHNELIGTALLAYPGAAEVASTVSQFYHDRKLYVTFGPGNGELPHFRALVNLSQSVVENSGPIQ